MKKACLIFAVSFLLVSAASFAQPAQAHLRISVLTCAPGEEMETLFGHTAIRIIDSIKKTDLIFNYGTFDFDDPDFYFKFVRGKLNYSLSVESLPNFLYEFQLTHRNVTEQELFLSDSTKQAINNAIATNLVGNNRYYKYDFLYDNCTSRVKNILAKYAGMNINKQLVPQGTSFRDMIHEYVDRGGMQWTKLGMDILLGSPSDKAVSISESMFLPDYLLKGIDSSVYSASPVLLKKQLILSEVKPVNTNHTNWPVIVFSVITAVILVISFLQNTIAVKITRLCDSLVFLITGLVGCLLLFTWFGTDHGSFAANYNLWWALPTNLVAVFAVWKKRRRLQKYFFVTSLLYGLLLALWYWLPQQLNPAFIPIVLLLFLRSVRLSKD